MGVSFLMAECTTVAKFTILATGAIIKVWTGVVVWWLDHVVNANAIKRLSKHGRETKYHLSSPVTAADAGKSLCSVLLTFQWISGGENNPHPVKQFHLCAWFSLPGFCLSFRGTIIYYVPFRAGI